jgi:hypothetical protein
MATYKYRQVKVRKGHKSATAPKKEVDYETVALVLGISLILLIAFFISYAAFSGWFSRIGRPDTEIIFLRPPICTEKCLTAENMVKSVAKQAHIGFSEAKYGPSSLPGYAIFFNDSALINGYVDEDSFKEQICGFTKIEEVCNLAKSRQQQ